MQFCFDFCLICWKIRIWQSSSTLRSGKISTHMGSECFMISELDERTKNESQAEAVGLDDGIALNIALEDEMEKSVYLEPSLQLELEHTEVESSIVKNASSSLVSNANTTENTFRSLLSQSVKVEMAENSRPAESCSNSGESKEVQICDSGLELSLCRHLLRQGMGIDQAAKVFDCEKVSLESFKALETSPSFPMNKKLVARVGGKYYPSDIAMYITLGMLAYGQVIIPQNTDAIKVECPAEPTSGGSWRLWPPILRKPGIP